MARRAFWIPKTEQMCRSTKSSLGFTWRESSCESTRWVGHRCAMAHIWTDWPGRWRTWHESWKRDGVPMCSELLVLRGRSIWMKEESGSSRRMRFGQAWWGSFQTVGFCMFLSRPCRWNWIRVVYTCIMYLNKSHSSMISRFMIGLSAGGSNRAVWLQASTAKRDWAWFNLSHYGSGQKSELNGPKQQKHTQSTPPRSHEFVEPTYYMDPPRCACGVFNSLLYALSPPRSSPSPAAACPQQDGASPVQLLRIALLQPLGDWKC